MLGPQRRPLPASVLALLADDDKPADESDAEDEEIDDDDDGDDESTSSSSSSGDGEDVVTQVSLEGGILALDSTGCISSREPSEVFAPRVPSPSPAVTASPTTSTPSKTTPDGTPGRGSVRWDPNSSAPFSRPPAVAALGAARTSSTSSAALPSHSRSGSGTSPIQSEAHIVTSPKSASEPGAEFPPFRLVRKLGNGGFGAVFHAVVESGQLAGSLVAVKQMPLDTDISREERVMCSLPPHPHCVRYLGTRRTVNHVYLVMEFASGGSLRSIRNATGPISPSVLRRYAYMTLLGLHHLHMHKIIHQDIKGDNVVVNELGNVKIVDFGCAKSIGQTTASLGGGGGTVAWMAPEVLRGSKPSTKSDVWSFGCMLLELTNETGSPWSFSDHMNTFQAVHAIANATQPPPLPSYMSSTAKAFITSCLQLDASKRPTVNALLQHAYFTAAAAEEELALDEKRMRACSTAIDVSARPSGGVVAAPASGTLGGGGDLSVQSVNFGFKLEAVDDEDDDDDDDESKLTAGQVKVSPLTMTRSNPLPQLPRTTPSTESKLGTPSRGVGSSIQQHSGSPSLTSPYTAQGGGLQHAPSVWESSGSAVVEPPHALYVVHEVDSKIAPRRKISGHKKRLLASGAAPLSKKPPKPAKDKAPGIMENLLAKFKCLSPT